MTERSVSRAASRLAIGQPAASHALSRLRDAMGDELFVRTPKGMQPTARAEQLADTVLAALAQIRGAIEGTDVFDPGTAARTFVISGGDYAGMVILPDLVREVRASAPAIDLRFRFVEKDQALAKVESGETDLAIGVFPLLPQHLASAPLIREGFVCVTARDHPVVATGLDLEGYVRWPHLLVTERGDARGAVDEVLQKRGLSRRIALTAPHVLLVPMLLQGTDLIATTGARAARAFAQRRQVAVHAPPLPLDPWDLLQVWPRRRGSDAGLRWLRELTHEICRK